MNWNSFSGVLGGPNQVTHAPPPFPTPPARPGYSPSYDRPPGPFCGALPSSPSHCSYPGLQADSYGPPSGPPPGQRSYPGMSSFSAPTGPPPGHPFAPPPGPPPGDGFGSPYAPPPGPPPGSVYDNPYSPPPGPPPGNGYGSPYGPPSPPGFGYGAPPGPPPSSSPWPAPQGGPYLSGQYATPPGPPQRPPSQVQHYGPQFETDGRQRSQPFFQYSQCNGRRKALLIGINYLGTSAELRGCINDVNNIKEFLISFWGYKAEDIVMLTDDASNPLQIPNRDNMIRAMQWLVHNAQPHDSLFFQYSGHGGQTEDLDGDEDDGYDEVIYPVDFEQAGHIVDDELHAIMVAPLPAGCRLTAIFDSCHSATALDLPYIYSTEGKIKEPNLVAEAGAGLLSAFTSYARGDTMGALKSAFGIVKTATGQNSGAQEVARRTRTSPADVISWSGCKDSQTSADTVEAGKATGAMSYAFIQSLSQKREQSYQELLISVRTILQEKYSQKPQLSASHPMDTSLMFIM